mgnify:CR=1 FL=1
MNTDSNNGWKILMSLAVVSLLVSAVLFFKSGKVELPGQDVQELVGESSKPEVNIASVDDVETALLKNVVDEISLLEESSNAEELSSDSEALEGLGKTYDENTI